MAAPAAIAGATGRNEKLGLSLLLAAHDAQILLELMDSGFYDEAQEWREWLLRAVAGSPEQVQIMYGIAGERRLTEWEVRGCPDTKAPRRCASAMPPMVSCSSTSSAR